MTIYSLDSKLEVLEPLAMNYFSRDRVFSLTPILMG